ncbi:unnamed protein product [Musa acuminata subsp. malaccensis]|uniref:(wild Malaysian banana) hypothetical protein n=1 Tax=Musa acuminata subsp. malaccensis TaxID=214687 RepID=A0A804I0L3_MUSAM|nr:unnamed protein product [Musa acuminata subsp. malaccensis]
MNTSSPCSRKAATSPPAKISSSFAIGPYCCLSLLSPRILLLLLFFFAAPLLGSSFGRAEGDFFDPTRVTQLSWRHRLRVSWRNRWSRTMSRGACDERGSD